MDSAHVFAFDTAWVTQLSRGHWPCPAYRPCPVYTKRV